MSVTRHAGGERPTLAVCLIARDEEARIGRALDSVRGAADEFIVVDTGSRDRTREIAAERGARVGDFPWCDDFSAARNAAVALASSEWVLWLDADEELLPECRAALAARITAPDAFAYLVLRRDLASETDATQYTTMWQDRLFRRRPGQRFIGRCHPQFTPTLEEAARREGRAVLRAPDIVLRHDGYVASRKPEKLRRGLRLLALELEERPGQLYYLVEYGRTLLATGEEEKGHATLARAVDALRPSFGATTPPGAVTAMLLEYLLATGGPLVEPKVAREEVEALTLRWFPRSAPLLWQLARRRFDAGLWREAADLLERTIALGKSGDYDHGVSFAPRIIGDDAMLNLGVCRAKLGDAKAAEACFRGLLSSPGVGPRAERNLALLRAAARPRKRPF